MPILDKLDILGNFNKIVYIWDPVTWNWNFQMHYSFAMFLKLEMYWIKWVSTFAKQLQNIVNCKCWYAEIDILQAHRAANSLYCWRKFRDRNTQCGKIGNFLSSLFPKSYVKSTFSLSNHTVNCFHEIFLESERIFLIFPHCETTGS